MSIDIVLSPSGHLLLRKPDESDTPGKGSGRWEKQIIDAFAASSSEGCFALAATKSPVSLSPTVAYWREYACRYLNELCRIPDSVDGVLEPIDPPPDAELMTAFLSAPPMEGGEYLSPEILETVWVDLDRWVREEVVGSGDVLSVWLNAHAPLWRQVGRVCFHLAENGQDREFPFAFLATYAPKLAKSGRVQYQPLGKALVEYAGDKNRKALINLLEPVQRATSKVDFVAELVKTGDLYHPLAWTPTEAYDLLQNIPVLEECGLLVRLPDWWKKRPRPRVSVTIEEKRDQAIGVDAMLDFQVGLAVGDEELSEDEWNRILATDERLVRIRGQWIEVDRERLEEALAHWEQVQEDVATDGVSFVEAMRLLAGAPAALDDESDIETIREWSDISAGSRLSEILSALRDPENAMADSSGSPTDSFNRLFQGTLRPYQETGRAWLGLLTRLGLGACLADDMGLGKTIQILALLATMKEQGDSDKPSLLVLPASLIANWKSEILKFAPSLETVFIHPSENDGNTMTEIAADPVKHLKGVDIVLTTYGMLLRQEWMHEVPWRLVVIDEAQAVKNPSARQTKAVKRLRADSRIALTGTPVENRLTDLWSLFDFLCPGLVGSMSRFKEFVKSMEQRGHDRYAPLRNLVRPYILRRLKTDKSIISDLPDKVELKAFCGLSKKQAALYSQSVEELSKALGEVDGMKRRGLVLSYLMRFKQICNHPSHFLGDGEYEANESGKYDRLGAICEELASRQEKVLVFTQFRELTEPIASYLATVFGREGLILHGGTAVGKRQILVDRFQQDDGPPFFVLSLKAGGTGLNLTAASHVVHFDRWWNPAVENQATDRAFRIGQHRNVTVHKFVCRGTVEERIDALIEEKSEMANDVLKSGGEAILTELSDDALIDIVSLDINRAQAF